MPTPLIELQRRLTLVGAIRAGGEKPERGVGRKLESWRLTSPRRELIEQAAALYGGEISPWQSPVGPEFQVYTTVPDLPVLVMPSYSLRQTYELWEGVTKRTRLCDGLDEEISGQPCLCNAEGVDRCDIYTRLVVVLPEVGTVHGWRVITRGANAAHELPTMLSLAQQTGQGQTFVPARLRIAQRRGVVDGQVARFVVPTLDLDVSYLALAAPVVDGSMAALPASTGHTAAPLREPTVEQALSAVAAPAVPPVRGGRSAAAFGPDDVDVDEPPPLPPAGDSTSASPTSETAPSPEVEKEEAGQTMRPTEAQTKKLNVLVGKLREAGQLKTESLYDAIGGLRKQGGLDLLLTLKGLDEEQVAHWAPLRDALTRPEAHQLIDWLDEKLRRVEAASAAGATPEAPAGPSEGDAATGPVPYNEFPPGYGEPPE